MKIAALLLLLSSPACSDPSDPAVTDGDADADSDADSDGDCDIAEVETVGGCAATVGQSSPCLGRGHVDEETEIDFAENPPSSGDHWGRWETVAGEHLEPIPRGAWIHNLEHGWIVLLHNCPAACDAELAVLRDVVAERPDARILMTPDPLLDPPRFAAVTWTWVHETDTPDLAELLCFVDQHEGQAPEDVH